MVFQLWSEGRGFRFPLYQFPSHELRLMALLRILLQEVWKEEDFEDGKVDKQLHADDQPERTPQRHLPETVVIETKGFVPETILGHKGQSVRFPATKIEKNLEWQVQNGRLFSLQSSFFT